MALGADRDVTLMILALSPAAYRGGGRSGSASDNGAGAVHRQRGGARGLGRRCGRAMDAPRGGGARRGCRAGRMRAAAAAGSPARTLSGAPVSPVDSRARANILSKPNTRKFQIPFKLLILNSRKFSLKWTL